MEPIALDIAPEPDPQGLWANRIRELLEAHSIMAMHLTGSDGCGKTRVMMETLSGLTGHLRIGVVTSDDGLGLDAQKYCDAGIQAVQCNLDNYHQLSSSLVLAAAEMLDPPSLDLLVVEHTGNLMLATRSDLGIKRVITCISVTQGWGPIEKYKPAYTQSAMNLITKSDLAQAVSFDIPRAVRRLKGLNPHAPVIVTSALTGDGVDTLRSCISRQHSNLLCEA